ncbi:MAG: hypothetical protein P8188_12590 [Gemmatimonadota bacterium]
MTPLLLVLLALNIAALAMAAVLYRRARKAERTRRVEAPNSQYKSPYVLDLEAKERWQSLELERVHEVNREEVERVLAKLKATSVRALTAQERAFLDRMVEAERRVKRSERRRRSGGSPSPATS